MRHQFWAWVPLLKKRCHTHCRVFDSRTPKICNGLCRGLFYPFTWPYSPSDLNTGLPPLPCTLLVSSFRTAHTHRTLCELRRARIERRLEYSLPNPSHMLHDPNIHFHLEQDALLFLDMQAPHAVLARTIALRPVGREDHTSWLRQLSSTHG